MDRIKEARTSEGGLTSHRNAKAAMNKLVIRIKATEAN